MMIFKFPMRLHDTIQITDIITLKSEELFCITIVAVKIFSFIQQAGCPASPHKPDQKVNSRYAIEVATPFNDVPNINVSVKPAYPPP